LKHKNDVLEAFKEFKNLTETQTGIRIKCLQSDNGKEYCNSKFDEFLKQAGIKRRLTVSYCPEQNGITERKNRTLVEMARCLLVQSGLAPTFWAEAINTANHLRNRCLIRSLGVHTPYEKWTGRVPYVGYFRSFGTRVLALNKKPTKGKFESRSTEGYFNGYSETSKAYRVWIPSTRCVETTRDVKFLQDFSAPETYEDLISNDTINGHSKIVESKGDETPKIADNKGSDHSDDHQDITLDFSIREENREDPGYEGNIDNKVKTSTNSVQKIRETTHQEGDQDVQEYCEPAREGDPENSSASSRG